MTRLRVLVAAAVIAAAASGVVLTGSPASAALPYCNNVSGVEDTSSGLTRYPTYVSSGSYTVACDMNWYNTNGTAGQRRAIESIQQDLNLCYGQGLVVDGEYGTKTREAVKNVQRYLNQFGANLVVDGWAGPKTRKAMKHVAVEGTFCTYPKIFSDGNPHIWPGWESI